VLQEAQTDEVAVGKAGRTSFFSFRYLSTEVSWSTARRTSSDVNFEGELHRSAFDQAVGEA
jgi:hypothetical protein